MKHPLCVERLCVGYGAVPILHDIDLQIEAGQITALVGPNGCGKSTLLKALARILKPQSGRVILHGKPIASYSSNEVARRIALLPQGPIAPEGLTVAELVGQGRFPHQALFRQWTRQDAAAVDRAMRATNVIELADRPVHSLSGGQRQRCWLAMALAQDAPLMLLDEPTTFLDLKVQIDLMVLLSRIVREEERTMVLVLHELNLAASFADKVVMMKEGQVQAQGSSQEVFRPEMLRSVFDLSADVIADPVTGRPVCLPRAQDDVAAT